MSVVKFHAVATWTVDGHHSACRPIECVRYDDARDAADRAWGNANAAGGREIEATVYQVYFDEACDRNDKPTLRETHRVFVGKFDGTRTWSAARDMPPAAPHVVNTWLRAMRHDLEKMQGGPAFPPDDVKRAGPQAISDWYRARMAAADQRHIDRQGAVAEYLAETER